MLSQLNGSTLPCQSYILSPNELSVVLRVIGRHKDLIPLPRVSVETPVPLTAEKLYGLAVGSERLI
jgi:hypothetical protein